MNFRKSLLTAALVVASTVASAGIVVTPQPGAPSPTSFAGLSGTFNPNVGSTGWVNPYSTFQKNATVSFDSAGPVVFTFIGKEAGNTNTFGLGILDSVGNRVFTTGASTPGATSNSFVAAGVFSFYFYDISTGLQVVNPSFAIGVAQGSDTNKALLVFNDNGSRDGDYDDMVVSVTAVPEPESFAMMLAGLGLMGAIARRRNKAKKAA